MGYKSNAVHRQCYFAERDGVKIATGKNPREAFAKAFKISKDKPFNIYYDECYAEKRLVREIKDPENCFYAELLK